MSRGIWVLRRDGGAEGRIARGERLMLKPVWYSAKNEHCSSWPSPPWPMGTAGAAIHCSTVSRESSAAFQGVTRKVLAHLTNPGIFALTPVFAAFPGVLNH